MMPTVPFPHRRRLDGSYAAVCPRCFLTVASARTEADLAKAEKNHVCDPETLRWQADILARSDAQWHG